MALTFTQAKATLDEIAQRSERNRKGLQSGRDTIARHGGDLTQMEADYGAVVTEINQIAAANPGDAAWQAAKAEQDKLVADFNVLKTRSVAMLTAVDSV